MYIKMTNGTPETYTIGQLRKDNRNTSFPKVIPQEVLAAYDVYEVVVQDAPAYDSTTHKVVQQPVSFDGTVATQGWDVVALTAEEIASVAEVKAQDVRTQRDALLSETDWMALTDVTMSPEMTTYRQALRDITSHANFPDLEPADWPVKPA